MSRALADCPDTGGRRQVLNAGCGEGAYLRLLERDEAQLWGTDVSKLAVRYAAKRQPAAHFAVGSPHALPFSDGSFDVVFSCFALCSSGVCVCAATVTFFLFTHLFIFL